MPSLTSSGNVSQGQDFMVAVSTRNSLVNTPNGGKSAIATVPMSVPSRQPVGADQAADLRCLGFGDLRGVAGCR